MDLVAFLSARLDEDERKSFLVHWSDCTGIADPVGLPIMNPLTSALLTCDCEYPARVLREVGAKRKILAHYAHLQELEDYPGGNPNDYHGLEHAGVGSAIDALAAVYSDHPDYDPAWNPEGEPPCSSPT